MFTGMKPGPAAPNQGTWDNSFHSSFLILKTILSSYQRVLKTRTVFNAAPYLSHRKVANGNYGWLMWRGTSEAETIKWGVQGWEDWRCSSVSSDYWGLAQSKCFLSSHSPSPSPPLLASLRLSVVLVSSEEGVVHSGDIFYNLKSSFDLFWMIISTFSSILSRLYVWKCSRWTEYWNPA